MILREALIRLKRAILVFEVAHLTVESLANTLAVESQSEFWQLNVAHVSHWSC